MKFVKRISYFFVIPVVFLILGIFLGVWGIHFFYPGQWQDLNENRLALPLTEEETAADTDPYEAAPSVEAAASGETLCADTEYVLEEADIVRGTTVETSWKIPHKYIGMNRENFLETMELYAAHPPLSEIERGFVGLEVLSFSREKVMVRMDYRYVQPSASFYLAVSDNEVVVYLEDRSTGSRWKNCRNRYSSRSWTCCLFRMKKHCMIFWRRIRPRILNKGDADEKTDRCDRRRCCRNDVSHNRGKRRCTGDDPGA